MSGKECTPEQPGETRVPEESGVPAIAPAPAAPASYYSPDPLSIGVGIAIILAMYLLPVIPFSFMGHFTLAQYVAACNRPFHTMLYGCTHSPLAWFFYAGWIVAVACIMMGLFNRTRK
jgi:hypothetical protein